MNWNHCSRVALLAALLVVAAAAPVAAVSVSADDVPDTVEVGSGVDVTYTFSDLYTDYDTWTLEGQTDLQAVTWTVTTFDVTGAKLAQETYTNATFSHQIAASDDVNTVTVRLQATVPEVTNWSYESPQTFVLASFAQTQDGGAATTLQTYTVRPYTPASQEARTAISQAQAAISAAEAAGADVSDAKADLQDAIEFYDNGNFEQAVKNANEAEQKAEAATASAQRTDLIIKIVVVVAALLLLGGGGYWYRAQRTTHDKLG